MLYNFQLELYKCGYTNVTLSEVRLLLAGRGDPASSEVKSSLANNDRSTNSDCIHGFNLVFIFRKLKIFS